MWTKDFKSSPAEVDDVEEDYVEMTGEGSGEVSRVDEDPFEKEMRLANETSAEELRVSFSIGLGVCQGTLMSTRRTLTS